MVARAVRNVHPLISGLLLAALLGGCADDLGSVARRHGVATQAIVRLSEGLAVAARRAGDGVEVLEFAETEGGWAAEVVAGGRDGEMTAHLVTMGGETGSRWNSFLFGTAPNGASRVVVDAPAAHGGQVADAVWVLAFRERDLDPSRLTWHVLSATGGVLESGTGITP